VENARFALTADTQGPLYFFSDCCKSFRVLYGPRSNIFLEMAVVLNTNTKATLMFNRSWQKNVLSFVVSITIVYLQYRSQPNILGGINNLTFGEQQYLVWDIAFRSTKWQDMLQSCGKRPVFFLATPICSLLVIPRCSKKFLTPHSFVFPDSLVTSHWILAPAGAS